MYSTDGMHDLATIDLSSNSVSGTAEAILSPAVIAPNPLTNQNPLSSFLLAQTSLSGDLPAVLWGLTDLVVLTLWKNVPPSISQLTKLEEFSLGGKHLTGTIPTELRLLTALSVLSITHSQISGVFC